MVPGAERGAANLFCVVKEVPMNGTVPVLSIVFMIISCAFSICLPVALFLYLRFVKKADIYPFFAGCTVMLLFAFILESGAHSLVFSSPAGPAIRGNVWLYALYGGFMAGLFEETGRYLAFSFALKKYRAKNVNALMYGAGHGGFEAIVLLGITMINNIAWSVMINNGRIAELTAALTGEQLAQAQQSIDLLITTPSYQFLMGGLERLFAIVLHISLSVLVWFAVKWEGKFYLYPLAILFHFAVDAAAVVLSGLGVNVIVIEVVVAAITAAVALYARSLWRETM